MQINKASHNLQKQHKRSITELFWKLITLKFQKLLKSTYMEVCFLEKF